MATEQIFVTSSTSQYPHRFEIYDIDETLMSSNSGVYMFAEKIEVNQGKFQYDIKSYNSSENLQQSIASQKELEKINRSYVVCIKQCHRSEFAALLQDINLFVKR